MEPLWPPILQEKVIITPQKLREVADLRAKIQKAVDEDTYVVAASPSQPALVEIGQRLYPCASPGLRQDLTLLSFGPDLADNLDTFCSSK
ncbi:uncharacterized protein [Drosophila takahashii]|uniref:uncharacterized protein isoform X2 n=1 Tax=Drosophila takahashii TaxID=29030 RepID=UPI0038992641